MFSSQAEKNGFLRFLRLFKRNRVNRVQERGNGPHKLFAAFGAMVQV